MKSTCACGADNTDNVKPVVDYIINKGQMNSSDPVIGSCVNCKKPVYLSSLDEKINVPVACEKWVKESKSLL